MSDAPAPRAADTRPSALLPMRQIVFLSIYWLGINAIWGGVYNVILQRRMEDLVGTEFAGRGLALVILFGAVTAILVQPTVGAISDYTVSRWGRRKPYIAIGAVLDVVFLVGIALSNDYLAIVSFVALLQFSSNFAQGPFQGYVPDLVPAQQVGLASGLMGLMIIFGRIVGVAIAAVGLVTGDFVPSTIGLGLFELATAIATLVTVDEGRSAPPRGGRSLLRIGLAAWGLDILKERSYVWLLASRLFILMATVMLSDLMLFYLRRSLRLTDQESAFWVTVAIAIVAVMTGLTSYPAARLSDRVGRKKTIYLSCAVGSIGLVGVVLAQDVGVAVAFAIPIGLAAGIFLAVDWALMTDIIPKATSGRYMGISNVVTGGSGPLAVILGGVIIDLLDSIAFGAGPRAAFALGIGFYAIGALLLRPVDERRREE